MKTPHLLLIPASILAGAPLLSGAEPWKQHAIDPARPIEHLSGADGVRLGDVNGDGRLDMVTGWEEGKAIRICLHPGPGKVTEPWPAITVGTVSSAEDAVFADLDEDGQLDVVTATEGKTRTLFVHWSPEADSIEDESRWKTEAFPGTEGTQWWMYTIPHDVDRDGDTDLLVGSKNTGGSITWFHNPGAALARDLTQWKSTRVADAGWIMSLRLFESGDQAFLLYSDRKGKASGLYLAPFLSEAPWIGEPVCIGAAGEEVMFLDVAHLDDDDKWDVAVAIRPDIVRTYYQPANPLQPWEDSADFDAIPLDRFGTAKAVRVGLLDEDDIPDIAITCERAQGKLKGVFWMNLFSEITEISNEVGVKYDRIEFLDLDEDGDLDLITCEERAGLGVIWFENPLR